MHFARDPYCIACILLGFPIALIAFSKGFLLNCMHFARDLARDAYIWIPRDTARDPYGFPAISIGIPMDSQEFAQDPYGFPGT